jgi:hypothetical protein
VLVAAEAHYAAALQAALAGVQIVVGAAPTLPVGASVQVHATRLILAPPSADLGDERGAARHFAVHVWPADGVTRSFILPPGDDEVAEVEAPPGYPRRRGDDYRVDAGALQFTRPPAAAQAGVRALLLGTPARGFVERRPCELLLTISARASNGLDALADAVLAAVLIACVDLPELSASTGAVVRARLRRPVAAVLGATRRTEPLGDAVRARFDLELSLRGEAELHVALGAPDPVDRIKSVEPGAIDVG